MRVLISSVGTRGDVQPVVALALAVRELGHDVRLCVPPNFIDWVAGLGFDGDAGRDRDAGPARRAGGAAA